MKKTLCRRHRQFNPAVLICSSHWLSVNLICSIVIRPARGFLFDACCECISDRTAYDKLKNWQKVMHTYLGNAYRNAQKESEKERAATKDSKRKKQLGEWESKLSEAVAKMNQQIDQEYEAAVKQVHFKIPCSGK